MIGKTFGHYEVIDSLGAGGMGEVYRARDIKLDRDVAMKVLPEDFAADAERLARFEREAKLLASLNHANIAGIYGFEDIDGVRFTAMELVEGETLEERMLQAGGLEVDEVLDIARQMATALEAAHENGVVHRDLKPANVKITPEGNLKVLDFGLAKAFLDDGSPSEMSPDLSRSPTMMQATGVGMILGTAAYMSPEQARGKPVDKRADIWSFGIVVFEMLTGRQPFRGETLSDTLADVLRGDLDWDSLHADTPAGVRSLLQRCLERDPNQRLRDIGEARIAIDRALKGEGEESDDPGDEVAVAAPAASSAPAAMPGTPLLLVIVVVTAIIAGFAGWSLAPSGGDPTSLKLGFAVEGLDEVSPVISPDGRMVVFSAQGRLWVRDISRAEPRELPGTEGALQLFWSPDGTAVGYMSAQDVYRVDLEGGSPTEVVRLPEASVAGVGGDWGPNDRIVFTRGNTGFYRVSARGGDPELILEPPGVTAGDHFHAPSFLPDGEMVFVVHPGSGAPDTIAVSSSEGAAYETVLRLDGQRISRPAYSPTGHIVFHRAPTLPGVWAVPFSLDEHRTTGEPFLVVPNGGIPSVSSSGVLSHSPNMGPVGSRPVIVNRAGEIVAALSDTQIGLTHPTLSPDGTQVIWSSVVSERRDLWIYDFERESGSPLTTGPEAEFEPAWFPDGERLAFQRNAGTPEVVIAASDGSGEPRSLAMGATRPAVSPDGKHVAFDVTEIGDTGADSISYVSLDGPAEPVKLVEAPGDQDSPEFSPDGGYLAYNSDESGGNQVYLTRFPDGNGRWQVSVDGGVNPRFNATGTVLVFSNGADIWEVPIDLTGRAPQMGAPQRVIAGAPLQLAPNNGFDVDAEGEIFVVVQQQLGRAGVSAVDLIFNWFEDFREGR